MRLGTTLGWNMISMVEMLTVLDTTMDKDAPTLEASWTTGAVLTDGLLVVLMISHATTMLFVQHDLTMATVQRIRSAFRQRMQLQLQQLQPPPPPPQQQQQRRRRRQLPRLQPQHLRQLLPQPQLQQRLQIRLLQQMPQHARAHVLLHGLLLARLIVSKPLHALTHVPKECVHRLFTK